MTPRLARARWIVACASLPLVLGTCTEGGIGPGRHPAALAVTTTLPSSAELASFELVVDNVRLIVVRTSTADTLFDQVFAFPANQTSLPLQANVDLEQDQETLQVTIQLLAGTTVLFSGMQDVTLTTGQTPPPADIPVSYAGPGQNITTLTIDPPDSSLSFGGAMTFRATASDAQENVVPNFYVSWTTSDTTIVKIDATGHLTAPLIRASLIVIARTPSTATMPNGVTASTSITFAPVATQITVVSGCGQSGLPGAQLLQPVVVKVIAGDGLGVKGILVQFAAPSSGSAAPPQVFTDANGLAQTFLTLPTQGVASFSIGASGLPTVTCTPTVQSLATQLAFTAQPTGSVVAGSPFTLVATVEDALGSPVTAFTGNVTLTIGVNPGGISFGAQTVAAVAGVATFPVTIDKAGTGYTFVASSGTLTPATTNPFDVIPAAPAQLAFTIGPPPTVAVMPIAPPLQVAIEDAFGNLVPVIKTVTMSFGTNPVSAVLGGTLVLSSVAGVATFDDLTIDKAATGYTLLASSPGLTNVESAAFDVAIIEGAQLVFTTQPTNVTAGSVIAPPVVVTARDGLGNINTSFTGAVTVAIGANSSNGVLGGTLSVNAVAGAATFSNLSIDKPGTAYTLVATAPAMPGATSAPFNVSAGNVAQLVCTSQPPNITAGTPLTPVVVTGQDAQGNTATGFTQNVSLAYVTHPVGVTLGGTTTVTAVAGVATFSNLADPTVTGGYSLVASATGLQSVVCASFTVVPAAATQLAFTVQPSTVGVGAVITPIVRVTIEDAFGNAVTTATDNVTVAIGTNPGNATLGGTLTKAAASGVALFTNLTLDQGGSGYTLIATSGSLTPATSTAFDITFLGAAVNAWTKLAGGVWSVAANWSLGRVPTAGDSVVISLNGTYTVTLDTTISVAFLTFGASSGTQTLALSTRTLTVTNAVTIQSGSVATLNSGAIAGAAGATNLGTLTLGSATIAGAFVNQGTLVATGASQIGGALTTVAGDSIIVRGNGIFGAATLTVSGGSWSNNGAIVLTDVTASYGATLAVPSGTLTNALGATIEASLGASGNRSLNAALNNQGTLTVSALATSHLAMNPPAGAALTNSAAITLTSGTLQITQTGASPSFTNTVTGTIQLSGGSFLLNQPSGGTPGTLSSPGTISIGSGQTFTVTGGVFTVPTGATVAGTGTLALSGATAGVTPNFNAGLTGLSLLNATWNGPGILTNPSGSVLNLQNSTIAAPFVNAGTLVATGASQITGTVATVAGDSIIVRGNGIFGAATLTVSGGSWTNNGAIVLTDVTASYGATLTVPSGTLTNALGATIDAPLGASGNRALNAALNNQGTLTVGVLPANSLSMSPPAGAVLTNSASITVTSGKLQITQTGASPTFTNTTTGTIQLSGGSFVLNQPSGGTPGTLSTSGAISIVGGQSFTVAGGIFNGNTGAVITGPGVLAFSGAVANINPSFNTGSTGLSLLNSTLNGPGSLTNAAGVTLNLQNSTIAGPFVNAGTLVASGASQITGTLATGAGDSIIVQGNGFFGAATLTVTGGSWTNNGAIVLTDVTASYGATLTMPNGTLTNAPGKTIDAVLGASGNRALNAVLNNQGTVTVGTAPAGRLTMSPPAGAALANSATITVNSGSLQITQTGTSPTFGNSGLIQLSGGDFQLNQPSGGTPGSFTLAAPGAITIGVGRTFTVAGGIFNINSATTFSGGGTLALSGVSANVTPSFNSAVAKLSLLNSTWNGSTTLTNAGGVRLLLQNSTIAAPFTNLGTLVATGVSQLTGTVTTLASDSIIVQGDGNFGAATLVVSGASGLTNNGVLVLTDVTASYGSTLSLPNGPLTNASGATIETLLGAGGARILTASLTNNGGVTVDRTLTLNMPDATDVNQGTIQLTGGDLNVLFSSGRPGFSNFGLIDVGTNTMKVSGPLSAFINQSTGTLKGSGTFDVTGTSFITDGITTVGGAIPGTLTFVGDYIQGPSPSVLNVRIAGDPAKPGVDYDQLRVTSGTATLQGGLLNVTMGTIQSGSYAVIQLPVGQTFTGNFGQENFSGACDLSPIGPVGNQYLLTCQ